MAAVETALIGGMAMGLASALHCGAMCSGVCSGALLFLQPASARQRIFSLLLLQGGRITTYALLGGAGALLGSSLITPDIAGERIRIETNDSERVRVAVRTGEPLDS